MSQLQSGPHPTIVKPKADVYTALLVVAILVLAVATVLVYQRLTGDVDTGLGYGMEVGDFFEPFKAPK